MNHDSRIISPLNTSVDYNGTVSISSALSYPNFDSLSTGIPTAVPEDSQKDVEIEDYLFRSPYVALSDSCLKKTTSKKSKKIECLIEIVPPILFEENLFFPSSKAIKWILDDCFSQTSKSNSDSFSSSSKIFSPSKKIVTDPLDLCDPDKTKSIHAVVFEKVHAHIIQDQLVRYFEIVELSIEDRLSSFSLKSFNQNNEWFKLTPILMTTPFYCHLCIHHLGHLHPFKYNLSNSLFRINQKIEESYRLLFLLKEIKILSKQVEQIQIYINMGNYAEALKHVNFIIDNFCEESCLLRKINVEIVHFLMESVYQKKILLFKLLLCDSIEDMRKSLQKSFVSSPENLMNNLNLIECELPSDKPEFTVPTHQLNKWKDSSEYLVLIDWFEDTTERMGKDICKESLIQLSSYFIIKDGLNQSLDSNEIIKIIPNLQIHLNELSRLELFLNALYSQYSVLIAIHQFVVNTIGILEGIETHLMERLELFCCGQIMGLLQCVSLIHILSHPSNLSAWMGGVHSFVNSIRNIPWNEPREMTNIRLLSVWIDQIMEATKNMNVSQTEQISLVVEELEIWEQRNCPIEILEMMEKLGNKKHEIATSSKENDMEPISFYLETEKSHYNVVVVDSTIQLLKYLNIHLILIDSLALYGDIHLDLMCQLIEHVLNLIKQWNESAKRSLLGGNSIRKGLLKYVTARHLAICISSLVTIRNLILIPEQYKRIIQVLFQKKRKAIYDTIDILDKHKIQMLDRIMSMITERLLVHEHQLIRCNWDMISPSNDSTHEEIMSPIVQISKELNLFYAVIKSNLSSKDAETIVRSTRKALLSCLFNAISSCKLKTTDGKERWMMNLTYLKKEILPIQLVEKSNLGGLDSNDHNHYFTSQDFESFDSVLSELEKKSFDDSISNIKDKSPYP